MTRKIDGFIITANRQVTGFAPKEDGEDPKLLWAGSTKFRVAVFKTKEAAKKALKYNDKYWKNLGSNWWANADVKIIPVLRAK